MVTNRWHDLQDRVADLNEMYRDEDLNLFHVHKQYLGWFTARRFTQ